MSKRRQFFQKMAPFGQKLAPFGENWRLLKGASFLKRSQFLFKTGSFSNDSQLLGATLESVAPPLVDSSRQETKWLL